MARGDALYALGRAAEAQTAYRDALKLEPSSATAQIGLGRTLVQSDPRAAEGGFLSALAIEPDNVLALNNLGVVRDLQGRHADAQESYSHALSVSPASADVQINLAMSLALSGHSTEASRLLRSMASDQSVARDWRKELTAALTLAGDGEWARRELPANARPPQSMVAAIENPALASPNKSSTTVESSKPSVDGGSATRALLKARKVDDVEPPDRDKPGEVLAIQTDPREAVTNLGPLPDNLSGTYKPLTDWERTPPQDTGGREAPLAGDKPSAQSGRIALARVKPEAVVADGVRRGTGDFYVQVASLTSEGGALFEWHRLQRRLPEFLANRGPTITPAEARGRTYWRLRTFGFAGSVEAKEMCQQLRRTGLFCWTGQGV
jgi:Flp pilus assembly protein TadD